MPELPEVESIRRELYAKVITKKILAVEVLRPSFIRTGLLPNAVGRDITDIRRRGKYLIIDTDSELKLYIHLRMTGIILWQTAHDDSITHVRAVIKLMDGMLLFKDVRALGGIWVADDGKSPWRKMGVEALSDDLNEKYLSKEFSKRKSAVKTALLDQGIIAGIGNIYASEALFRSNIHPLEPANKLTANKINAVIDSVKEILNASIDSAGTTFRDFKLSDGKKGGFSKFLKVYGKKDEPCSVCSTIIQSLVIAQRNTFFCPSCQKKSRKQTNNY